MKHITLAAVFCAASTLAVNAATYDFTYTFATGDVATGSLEGTLQADMNTIIINSMTTPAYNGTPNSETLTVLGAWSTTGTTPASTSLDGSFQDFFYVDVGITYGFGLWSAGFDGYAEPGITNFGTYNAANWSIEETTAPVPLPASGLMLGFAMLGAGYAARRKASAKAA